MLLLPLQTKAIVTGIGRIYHNVTQVNVGNPLKIL